MILHFLPEGKIEPPGLSTSSSLPTMVDKMMMETHWMPLWPSSFFKLVTMIDTITRETHTTTSRQISLSQSSFLLAWRRWSP